jgi:hypothetical protein
MVATKILDCAVLHMVNMQPMGHGGGIDSTTNFSIDMLLCEVSRCMAGHSGAISASNRVLATLDQCTFLGNLATQSHAACITINGLLFAEHCIFADNQHTGSGCAVLHMTRHPLSLAPYPVEVYLNNCLFLNNTALNGPVIGPQNGPFVPVENLDLRLLNCTLVGNSSTGASSLISSSFNNLSLTNCIVWDNSANPLPPQGSAQHCCVQPNSASWSTSPLLGNITSDPLLVNGPQGAAYLAPSSPCIDAGTATATTPALLAGLTTSVTEAPDVGLPDIGFHRVPLGFPRQPRSTMTYQQVLVAHGIGTIGTGMPPLLLIYE